MRWCTSKRSPKEPEPRWAKNIALRCVLLKLLDLFLQLAVQRICKILGQTPNESTTGRISGRMNWIAKKISVVTVHFRPLSSFPHPHSHAVGIFWKVRQNTDCSLPPCKVWESTSLASCWQAFGLQWVLVRCATKCQSYPFHPFPRFAILLLQCRNWIHRICFLHCAGIK